MSPKTNITPNHITTDDISFSAWLKMNNYPLIKIDRKVNKSLFVFDIRDKEQNALKMEFINSRFVAYYNELRNLKKLI